MHTEQLMLFTEIILVCFVNPMKLTNTVCLQNSELFHVTSVGTYSYDYNLNV